MTRQDYQLLMDELEKIAKKLDLFPENLHQSVFETLVEALLDRERGEISQPEGEESEKPSEAGDLTATRERDQRDLTELHKHTRLNDMEFSALTALYFADLVASDERTESIGPDHLIEACKIVGRKVPSNPATTLNNALHVKGYLENTGKWGNPRYRLTPAGRKFLTAKLSVKYNPRLQQPRAVDNFRN